jgi:hypothetical protein
MCDLKEKHDLSHQKKERDRKKGERADGSEDARDQLGKSCIGTPKKIGKDDVDKQERKRNRHTQEEEKNQRGKNQDE